VGGVTPKHDSNIARTLAVGNAEGKEKKKRNGKSLEQ
jgi:hypothetical protein